MTIEAEHADAGNPASGNRALIRTLALAGAALFALALGLWAQYGTAIFMETMANAWAYCF